MKKLCNTPVVKIVPVLYTLLFFIYFILIGVGKMMFAPWKSAQPTIYTADMMELCSMLPAGDGENVYYSTDADPQILIRFRRPVAIGQVEISIDSAHRQGPVVVYYCEEAGQDFSEFNRVVYTGKDNGIIKVKLNQKKVSVLRIDPSVYGGLRMKINSVTVNSPAKLVDYFDFSLENMVYFAIFSGFFVSAVILARQFLIEFIYEKKKTD